jgi:hypothetical protein
MRNLLHTRAKKGSQAHRLQPSDSSGVNPDHLSYFEMLGKLIGVRLWHGEVLPLRLTLPFLKQLLFQLLLERRAATFKKQMANDNRQTDVHLHLRQLAKKLRACALF